MTTVEPGAVARRTALERDLFLRLLELGHQANIELVLRDALALAVEVTGADRGHIHVFGEARDTPEWSLVLGCSANEMEQVRALTSRGIEAEAIATGKVVQTPSALLDSRFANRASVREQKIEAVICAPIGGSQAVGVLYLHGKARPFAPEDEGLVELFCRHLGPAVRWLAQQQRGDSDPTEKWRQRLRVDGIVGRSASVARLLEFVSIAASADIPVLLTGESGCGKTLVARAIHNNGRRVNEPFVEVNCAAVPDSLFEAELFGAKRGAYTDAKEDRIGKVEAADKGTLFLDEIGELSQTAQAKLLQFLQSSTYSRLGDTEPRRANARIIAATNANLEEDVENGRFRRDLYYRLNVFPFRVPALSERTEDIPVLIEHFVRDAARRHDLDPLPVSPAGQLAVTTTRWPGNLRELGNAIEAALVRARAMEAEQIDRRHLFPGEDHEEDAKEPTYQESMRRYQRSIVQSALEAVSWNIPEAAKRLDITRAYLYNLIKAHGLRNR
jgi:Nif-specific regulatory protein